MMEPTPSVCWFCGQGRDATRQLDDLRRQHDDLLRLNADLLARLATLEWVRRRRRARQRQQPTPPIVGRTQRTIYGLLVLRDGDLVTHNELALAIWRVSAADAPMRHAIRAAVSRLRRVLPPNERIEAVAWSGYRLVRGGPS